MLLKDEKLENLVKKNSKTQDDAKRLCGDFTLLTFNLAYEDKLGLAQSCLKIGAARPGSPKYSYIEIFGGFRSLYAPIVLVFSREGAEALRKQLENDR